MWNCTLQCPIVMVTSATNGTGKSSLTMMLGKSMAQTGKKVLLIDADIYKRSLSRQFQVESSTKTEALSLFAHARLCVDRKSQPILAIEYHLYYSTTPIPLTQQHTDWAIIYTKNYTKQHIIVAPGSISPFCSRITDVRSCFGPAEYVCPASFDVHKDP